MLEIPMNLAENCVRKSDGFIIKAPEKNRYLPIVIGFIMTAIAIFGLIYGIYDNDTVKILMAMGMLVLFGLMGIHAVLQIFNIPEILLLPEKKKIILRSERTKKVISEHPIDDIEVRIESVHHEDPSRTPMRWFTLFDTNRQKQIFAVRTAGPGGETYDTAELKEFFYEVMGKKQ